MLAVFEAFQSLVSQAMPGGLCTHLTAALLMTSLHSEGTIRRLTLQTLSNSHTSAAFESFQSLISQAMPGDFALIWRMWAFSVACILVSLNQDKQTNPVPTEICSRTPVGCFVPPSKEEGGDAPLAAAPLMR